VPGVAGLVLGEPRASRGGRAPRPARGSVAGRHWLQHRGGDDDLHSRVPSRPCRSPAVSVKSLSPRKIAHERYQVHLRQNRARDVNLQLARAARGTTAAGQNAARTQLSSAHLRWTLLDSRTGRKWPRLRSNLGKAACVADLVNWLLTNSSPVSPTQKAASPHGNRGFAAFVVSPP
jgi:hypothetical protein